MTSDSRWRAASTSAFDIHDTTRKSENDRDLYEIRISLSGLPTINHTSLRHHGDLGRGSYGLVALEKYDPRSSDPYFVAVKYIITHGRSPEELHRAYRAFKRELRVLAHPPLKNHLSILQAIGHGTADRAGWPADPYLVLEYSDHGTLDRYVLSRAIHHNECRELALDVAVGLEALHKNKILHGDVKPHNILVFDAGYHTSPPRRVAKISDFGNTITEEEITRFGQRPYGTQAYVAPELDADSEVSLKDVAEQGEKLDLFEAFCRTDVYSFGLLLWELFRLRECGAENKLRREDDIDFESRRILHNQHQDGLVQRATTWVLENLTERYKEPGEARSNEHFRAIDAALNLCLRDDARDRGHMSAVVRSLTIASGERRSQRMYAPTRRNAPRTDESDRISDTTNSLSMTQADATPRVAHWRIDLSNYQRPSNSTALVDDEEPALTVQESVILFQDLPPPGTPAEQITTLVHTRRPYTEVVPHPVSDRTIDVFEASILQLPPWGEQVRIYESFGALVETEGIVGKLANAQLQLAACHFTGFGTTTNRIEGSWCLHEAAKTDFTASTLQARAWFALSDGEAHLHPPQPSHLAYGTSMNDMQNTSMDFVTNVRNLQQLAGKQVLDAIQRRMNVYTARDHISSATNNVSAEILGDRFMQQLFTTRHIPDMLANRTHNPKKTSLGLTLAYHYGILKVAEPLTRVLSIFLPTEGCPTPLHWLISFEPSTAALLASILVNGPDLSAPSDGICKSLLDAVVDEPVKFPEHAMELFGTPLHWAARVGNLALVKILVSLGANINARCFPRLQGIEDPSSGHVPYQSPLDVAAMFHYSHIVDYLLHEGAHICGGDGYEHHTALHMVGQLSHPLARMVIHGSSYQRSVRNTIRSFLQWGLDINVFAKPYAALSYTPLRWALHSLRSEEYIVKALLEHGATEPQQLLPQDVPLAVFVAHAEAYRSTATWKLRAILHLVKDVNERGEDDEYGRNALHFCIQNDNKGMADLLASTGQLDFESRVTKQKYTPLMYATVLARTEIARWLLNNGSSVEPSGSDKAPLETAVFLRHLEVIVLLLGWGASTTFGPIDPVNGLPRWSILHQAVMGTQKELRRSSFMRTLLDRLSNLKTFSILNQQCSADSGTPLHWAVVQGDFEAVQVLLEAGANPAITNHNDPVMRASIGCRAIGSPLEVATKCIARYDKKGPNIVDQPWLKDCTPDSSEAKHYRNSLEEIQILLSRAQKNMRI